MEVISKDLLKVKSYHKEWNTGIITITLFLTILDVFFKNLLGTKPTLFHFLENSYYFLFDVQKDPMKSSLLSRLWAEIKLFTESELMHRNFLSCTSRKRGWEKLFMWQRQQRVSVFRITCSCSLRPKWSLVHRQIRQKTEGAASQSTSFRFHGFKMNKCLFEHCYPIF